MPSDMDPIHFAATAFLNQYILFLLRYILICGGAVAVIRLFSKALQTRKIQEIEIDLTQTLKEIKNSLVSFAIFASVGTVSLWFVSQGYSKMYFSIDEYGIGYFVFSIFVMILIHDTYFYWVHRLIHLPKLYQKIHFIHHQSKNPTPWASFSFHPYEALLMAPIGPIVIYFMPNHPLALLCFFLFMTMINSWGHLGYEILPKWFPYRFPTLIWNTSVHHNQHHQTVHHNFGLYFNLWDRLMGTNHPEYFPYFDQVKAKCTQEKKDPPLH